MIKVGSVIFTFCLLTLVSHAQTFYGTTDLKTFRDGRDKEFGDKQQSPLKEEDFDSFKGLNYFPVDNRFRVTAKCMPTSRDEWLEMETSTGKTKKFIKYGLLKFTLNDKPLTLAVYQMDPAVTAKFPDYADLLFVPFKDRTSRTETYQGGRYMDMHKPKGKTVILDFNLAYNPNCAYGGTTWNCPIPPAENVLDVAITAGEKRYAYSGAAKGH